MDHHVERDPADRIQALPELFNTSAACRLFGCTPRTWRRFVRRNRIPRTPAPGHHAWYSRVDLLEAITRSRDIA